MNTIFSKYFSALWTNLFFTAVQVYGLLFFNWSGLYIIYLVWIELFFLSLFTAIRFWQLVHTEAWLSQKDHPVISIHPEKAKEEFAVFVFIRILYLSLYLLLIGVTVVPLENMVLDYKEVKTIAQFIKNLIITDPLFIVAVFFVVFYYLKLMFSKIDISEAGLVEFSFNVNPYDFRILTPFVALASLFFGWVFVLIISGSNEEVHSNTYIFAVWLLVIRTFADSYLIYQIKKELKKRGL